MNLEITHLNPGSENHVQSVLENLHYNHEVTIIRIYQEDNKKMVEYEVKDKS